jgi:hypothetical protein
MEPTFELQQLEPLIPRYDLTKGEVDRIALGPQTGQPHHLSHQAIVDLDVGPHAITVHSATIRTQASAWPACAGSAAALELPP